MIVLKLTYHRHNPLTAPVCHLFVSEILLKLLKIKWIRKNGKASSWKIPSKHFEICAMLLECFCAIRCVSHTAKSVRHWGSHLEPFSHTFPSVDTKFKARLGNLFCQMAASCLERLLVTGVFTPCTAAPLQRDTASCSLFYIVAHGAWKEKKKVWAQGTVPPKPACATPFILCHRGWAVSLTDLGLCMKDSQTENQKKKKHKHLKYFFLQQA